MNPALWVCHGYSWTSRDGQWLISPEHNQWVLSRRTRRNWHPYLFFKDPESAALYAEEQP